MKWTPNHLTCKMNFRVYNEELKSSSSLVFQLLIAKTQKIIHGCFLVSNQGSREIFLIFLDFSVIVVDCSMAQRILISWETNKVTRSNPRLSCRFNLGQTFEQLMMIICIYELRLETKNVKKKRRILCTKNK